MCLVSGRADSVTRLSLPALLALPASQYARSGGMSWALLKSHSRQTRWMSRSRIKNTAHVRYSVRENSISWRKLDGSAGTSVQPSGI